MWENLVPPFNIYCGGTSIIRGVPQGTLSHTHLGSDTVALNETRRLHLGLAFQSQTCTRGPCGDAMLDYPPRHLRQGVRLKRDSERDRA